jgi:hypothetical protein
VRHCDGWSELRLPTSGGVTEAGPDERPFFFSGFLTEPAVAATGMLACAAVARSRYFLSGNVLASLRDPVVTSNCDRLRFESFSSCCGVHSRLDLLPEALAEPPVASGTTNVDFNDAMRGVLASAAISGPVLLSVGSGEVVVDAAEGSVTERKVPLPDRWLKGFGEVQALARQMRPVGELTGAAARRFVRSLPRSARRPLWTVPAGGTFSLVTTARPGAACIAEPLSNPPLRRSRRRMDADLPLAARARRCSPAQAAFRRSHFRHHASDHSDREHEPPGPSARSGRPPGPGDRAGLRRSRYPDCRRSALG